MTDLVERLRRLLKTCDREWFCFPLVEEAATALEAKDKELEALRERVKGLEQERNVQMLRALNATASAETAERETEALKSEIERNAALSSKLITNAERNASELANQNTNMRNDLVLMGMARDTAERERDHFKGKAHEYFGMYDVAMRERDEAREALKPFAALGRWLTSKIPDDEVVYRVSTATVTAGDLRRAVRSCFWRLTQ